MRNKCENGEFMYVNDKIDGIRRNVHQTELTMNGFIITICSAYVGFSEVDDCVKILFFISIFLIIFGYFLYLIYEEKIGIKKYEAYYKILCDFKDGKINEENKNIQIHKNNKISDFDKIINELINLSLKIGVLTFLFGFIILFTK